MKAHMEIQEDSFGVYIPVEDLGAYEAEIELVFVNEDVVELQTTRLESVEEAELVRRLLYLHVGRVYPKEAPYFAFTLRSKLEALPVDEALVSIKEGIQAIVDRSP